MGFYSLEDTMSLESAALVIDTVHETPAQNIKK